LHNIQTTISVSDDLTNIISKTQVYKILIQDIQYDYQITEEVYEHCHFSVNISLVWLIQVYIK